jgi:hypothetical protein
MSDEAWLGLWVCLTCFGTGVVVCWCCITARPLLCLWWFRWRHCGPVRRVPKPEPDPRQPFFQPCVLCALARVTYGVCTHCGRGPNDHVGDPTPPEYTWRSGE